MKQRLLATSISLYITYVRRFHVRENAVISSPSNKCRPRYISCIIEVIVVTSFVVVVFAFSGQPRLSCRPHFVSRFFVVIAVSSG